MRSLITTCLEIAGACLVGVSVGFEFGLWPALIVAGCALVLFGATSA